MKKELIDLLKELTPEEQHILSGDSKINKELYMAEGENRIDARKMLEDGKLIQVRPHTRYIHFPEHTHNYIELIYMCSGTTHHIINKEDVILQTGELLFLNQNAVQEIYPARETDLAVNFIILPEFFDYSLKMMEEEENLLRDFIVDCLKGKHEISGYLHFKVADILPIQNLIENLVWTILYKQSNRRSINQITMGLLFLQLMNHMDKLQTDVGNINQKLVIQVLGYIEEHYRDGELSEFAKRMNYSLFWMSKEIKKRTGKTYTELVQAKRLNQAAYLLKTTEMSVSDVGIAIGYDNISYFHRIFQIKYGITPRRYRILNKDGL